ncbi:MAG: DUF1993 domain-containing protein [Myxococcales bacterium]|nr:DUF1993 domain-containing protein [Myxococcales bacterium]
MAAQLGQLATWLDKAVAHGEAKKFEPDTLLTAWLAPDQFPLVRQIGAACDTAKLAAARLTGRPGPTHADDQRTCAACRARVADVIAYLDTLMPTDFAEAADAQIQFPWMPGKYLTAADYLLWFAIPNFHFHLAHAYAILRHNGVELGKSEFLGALPFRDL